MPPSDEFSIDRVAELARIDISDADSDEVQNQISQILNFISVLDELELDHVQPFFGLDLASDSSDFSPQRDDKAGDSIPRDIILSNAPKNDGQFYKVPPVF